MPTAMLSEHFSLAEFTQSQTAARRGLGNTPNVDELLNLKRLAGVMERVREICGGNEVTITSGYRGAALNKHVGGSLTSAHMHGLACDFIIPGFGDPHAVCLAIEPHLKELEIDQLILEMPPNGWVHLGLSAAPPRCECLTLTFGGGYTAGIG
jgi:hypothetical protein